MADKRYALINKLRDQSVSANVSWERTETKGVFQASFPNYSVRIDKQASGEPEASLYILRIYNDEGSLIEEFNDEDLPRLESSKNPYQIMGQLYDVARRQAMGVDAALDSLLTALDDGPPDDSIPF